MIKGLILSGVALLAIFSARCQTTPTRLDSTSQPRDNRVVVNKTTENHSEANKDEVNSEKMNTNANQNSESKAIVNTNTSEANTAVNKAVLRK